MITMPFRHPEKPTETSPPFLQHLRPTEWIVQTKYDGWRMLVFVDRPGKIRCLTHSGRELKQAFRGTLPDLESEFDHLKLDSGLVLDTEFVGPRGHLSPAVYIFDCLARDGHWLSNTSYEERWRASCLAGAGIKSGSLLNLSETIYPKTVADIQTHFDRLKQEWITGGRGLALTEGIVLKRRGGTTTLDLRSCRKSYSMFKLKFRDGEGERY